MELIKLRISHNLFQKITFESQIFLFCAPGPLAQVHYCDCPACFLSSFVEFHSAVSEEKLKCLNQSEARAASLFFSFDQPKNTNLVEGVEILLPVKFRRIPFSGFRWEVGSLSQSEAVVAILVFRSAQKHKLGRGCWDLASCQVLLNSVHQFQRRSR